jgi:AcrR family transcriptional regulator
MSTQVKFLRVEEATEGLRSRKKAKMRIMIEDAALDLFAERGYEATTVEQIAAEVEISTTTFFRYFPSKADVVLCQQDAHLPRLREIILAFPSEGSDLAALRHAILEVWVPNIDSEHSRKAGLAVAKSASLRGLHNDLNRTWLEGVAKALASRRGLTEADDVAMITARVVLGVFNEAVRSWGSAGYGPDVGLVIERAFATLKQLSAQWAE